MAKKASTTPKVKETKPTQVYTFPELGVAVVASSLEDAEIKARKESKEK